MDSNKSIEAAIACINSGHLRDAEDLCLKLIERMPNNAEALHLLGVISHQLGKSDAAVTYLKKALQIDPNYADAYSNLGNVHYYKKQFDEAIRCFLKALRLKPNLAKTWFNLGMLLQDRGNIDEAITAYQEALYLNLKNAGIMNNLGLVFQKKRQFDKSIVYYRKALDIDPGYAEAYYNLGNVLKEINEFDQAITQYQQALQINPNYGEAYTNLGLLLHKKGLLEESEKCFRKALQTNAKLFEAYNNLGNVLQEMGRMKEALDLYQKVLAMNPLNAGAYNNIGTVLKDQGKTMEAEMYYRKALQREPDSPIFYSNLLLVMNYNAHYDAQAVFAGHFQFAKHFEEPLRSSISPHTNERTLNRRLKIGYVSPNFRQHSVSYFIEPVLASHRHEHFEIFCYSDVLIPDIVTECLQGYADKWRNIAGIPDEQVADIIRQEGIDILIDLAGHTGHNRILLFARKPAPVQASWIGYPATTGLSTMDYKIVDQYTDPPGTTEGFYSETLVRLPESFLCYLPEKNSPELGPLPALESGVITFGSFNNFAKVTEEVIALWAKILTEVPDSRLILKTKIFADTETCNYVRKLFAECGINPYRIELMPLEQSYKKHLSLYNRIDIGLDPFPYNGTTTTCESLWMGVPVVTLAGTTHASRVGTSILSNIGMPELIVKTSEEYIARAVHLATDIKKLQLLRDQLRGVMAHSALTDAKRFTANLEICFRAMWNNWCKSL